MRKVIPGLLLMLFMIFIILPDSARASSSNLLTNPGGEITGADGLLSNNGWMEDTGTKRGYSYSAFTGAYNESYIALAPKSGNYFMGFYAVGSTTYSDGVSCYQDINVTDQTAFNLSGYLSVKKDTAGRATLGIEARDMNGNVLRSYSQNVTSADGDWKQVSLADAIPSGTAILRVTITGILHANGLTAFDDLSLALSKAPAASPSANPTASITTIAKTAEKNAQIHYTLTNDPVYPNTGLTWKMYTSQTGTTTAEGLYAYNDGNTLILASSGDDVPAATYYVSVTESGKAESGRLELTVGAYVPPVINVAQIGTTGYATLQAAVNAAAMNDTIKLLENIDPSNTVTITSNNSFTLDLNGKTLDSHSNTAIVHSGSGTLTITDNSSNADGKITSAKIGISFSGEICGTIYQNGGSFIIEKGMVRNTAASIANNCIAIYMHAGNVSVRGGEVSTTGAGGYTIINNSTGELSISDGTVSSTSRSAVYNNFSGKVNVSGGTVSVTANNSNTIYNNSIGKVNISGGTVSIAGENSFAINNSSTGTVSISGGRISAIGAGSIGIYNYSAGAVTITGGTPIISGEGKVAFKVLDLSSYKNVKITASTSNTDGTETSTITKSNMDTDAKLQGYKYLKFEPGTVPSISISDATVTEGNMGISQLTFTLTLSSASEEWITVDYSTAQKTAISGQDFEAKNGTLTFPAGETTKTMTIIVYSDTTLEPDESMELNLTNPTNATIAKNTAQGLIINDDASVPGAPTIGNATAGLGQATVTFSTPIYDGGSAITGYMVISYPGGVTATGTSSPITVSGLTNGLTYTFTVVAINAKGSSLESSYSNSVIPGVTPAATTSAATKIATTSATLHGIVNANNSGLAEVRIEYGIDTSYGNEVTTVTPSNATGNTNTSVSGNLINLTPGTTYHYRIVVTNRIGTTYGSDQTFTTLALPKVTDKNITFSGATGTGGVYKIGDTVTVSWNNTSEGDNNSGITSVSIYLHRFKDDTSVSLPASNSGGIWTASYTILPGNLDITNATVRVAPVNPAGQVEVESTQKAIVDNNAPIVTDAKILLNIGNGVGGAYKLGDAVMVMWNDTSLGDNNADTIRSVAVDFSAFGGGKAVMATDEGDFWTASYTINASSPEGTGKNVSLTVTDNAGNTTTTTDTTNATVRLKDTISNLDLTGKLTTPVIGATPSTAAISDTQYTGTVSWNGSPSKFLGNTVYTATVNLTAGTGFTFDEVAKDAFRHTKATEVTNAVGSGNIMTVTIVFPVTAERTLQSIVITTPPTKVGYKHGEGFSKAGMVVKASYNDGSENTDFKDYAVDKTTLVMSNNSVTITANGTSVSVTQSITVSRADGPAVSEVSMVAAEDCTNTQNNDGKLTGVTGAMEYKKEGAASYTNGKSDGSAIAGLTSGTYLVRVKETTTHNAGADSTFIVKEYVKNALTGKVIISGTPKFGQTLTATYTPGNSTGTLSYQWKRGNDNIGTGSNSYKLVEADVNKVITCEVQSTEQNGSVTGNTTTIAKADGPSVSGVTAVGCTNTQNNDGKLTGVTGAMEYKKEDAASYTDGSAITGLTSGTYLVRVKETTTHNAGAVSIFSITAYAVPTPNNGNSGNSGANEPAKKEGKIEKDQKKDENAPTANLNDSTADLKTKVLSAAEQEQVITGKDAKVILKVEDISASVSDEEKKQIEEKIAAEQQNTTNVALLYVDISLYKQIGDGAETRVTETSGKISISLEVPESMRNTEDGVDRSYRVIRIHNGVTEVLEGSYDPVTHLFTFQTDRFSTYALTYQDLKQIAVDINESKAGPLVQSNDFNHLRLTAKAAKTSQKLSYIKAVGADGYLIYGGKCGEKLTELADLSADTTSYTIKKLQQGTYYKYQVKAYKIVDGKKVILMTSKLIHSMTEDKTYANPTKVDSDTATIILKIGKTKTISCQVVLSEGKKMKQHTAVVRYEASDKNIATVSSKGKITAKAKGTCFVYAYAQNGVYQKIKVTVK